MRAPSFFRVRHFGAARGMLLVGCEGQLEPRSTASITELEARARAIGLSDAQDSVPFRSGTELNQRTSGALIDIARKSGGQLRVGLKLTNSPRGIWRGRWLLTEKQRDSVSRLVAAELGVRAVSLDPLLPAAIYSVGEQTDIERLREHPNVDYLVPTLIPAEEFSLSTGCGADAWSGPLLAAPIGGGDLMSSRLSDIHVDRAWRYGFHGNGVTIGWVDTGVDNAGGWPELSAMGSRLTALSPNNGSDCSHGNRMVIVSSASGNGTGSVGIAPSSSVIMSDLGGTVFPSGVPAYDALQRLYLSGGMPSGSKIIALGWGLSGFASDISDLIDLGYYTRGFAFFAPAGSLANFLPVVFPASKTEVFAATARTSVQSAHPSAHVGDAVDGIAFAPVFLAGVGGAQIQLDNSSAATAQLAGAAAQVLHKFPSLTNSQLYSRLRSTAREYCGPAHFGVNKIINVEAAIGGLCIPPGQFNEVTYTFYNGTPASFTHSYCFTVSGGVWPQYTVNHVNPHPYLPGCGSVTLYPEAAQPDRTLLIQATAWDNFTPNNPPLVNHFRIRIRTLQCPPELPNCV